MPPVIEAIEKFKPIAPGLPCADARYANKSSECRPKERGEGLVDGGPLECASFPGFV